MPHSPRVYNGEIMASKFWNWHELGYVDFEKNKNSFQLTFFLFQGSVVALILVNIYFIGLSRPRYERFEGLELDQN